MTPKALIALPLVALLAGCVGGNDVVDTQAEREQTLDMDLDGDGAIETPMGIEVPEIEE
jgi:hypothetical protein